MVGHSIQAVAFVGKSDDPLYYFTEEDTVEALNLQMIIYGSLDIVDERRKKPLVPSPNVDPQYLGSLYAVDDYQIYGHLSNTNIKTILVCDNAVPETYVRSTILLLSGLYATAIQNPFQAIGEPIVSKRFSEQIQKAIGKNQTPPSASSLIRKA